jgi:hypothetical protein
MVGPLILLQQKRPHSFIYGNICFEFSVQCLCSATAVLKFSVEIDQVRHKQLFHLASLEVKSSLFFSNVFSLYIENAPEFVYVRAKMSNLFKKIMHFFTYLLNSSAKSMLQFSFLLCLLA